MKKAQIQFDYMVGFFLFLIVVFFAALFAMQPVIGNTNNLRETKVFETSSRISELLIKTKGLPENWEEDTDSLERLGLASKAWVLDINKVNNLSSLNYSQVRESLDIETYQFFLEVKTESNSVRIGDFPVKEETVSMMTRYAVLDGETATVIVGIW